MGKDSITPNKNNTAAQILNRANIRESRGPSSASPSSANVRESRIVFPKTNANTREGRSSVGGVGSSPIISTGLNITQTGITKTDLDQNTTPVDNGDTISGGMVPAPSPQPSYLGAKDLGVVKNPSRDVTNIANLVPQADESTVARLLFEQFSAVELAQVLTPRTIDGIEQQYSIISNLSDVRRRYNSTKELTIMDKLSPISGVFGIDINSKIPGEVYIQNNNLNATYSYLNENNELVTVEKGHIYIDTNGDLVIEFENMRDDEFIQVQIDSNGTIYGVTN